MKKSASVLGAVLFFSVVMAGSAWAQECFVTPEEDRLVRTYMYENGHDHTGIGRHVGDPRPLDVRYQWLLVKSVRSGENCVQVMDLCMITTGEEGRGREVSCEGGAYEIFVRRPDVTVARFEEVNAVPERLRAAMGWPEGGGPGHSSGHPGYFYVELSGDAVVSAYKAMAARLFVAGFVGELSAEIVRARNGLIEAVPDGKLAWDPTPQRKWKVKSAQYVLGNLAAASECLVAPRTLDDEFSAFYMMSGGCVALAHLMSFEDPATGEWVSVKYDL